MQSRNIKTVAIVGGGFMGSGIAQVSAANGFNVNLVDSNEQQLAKAKKAIETSLSKIAKKKFASDEKAGSEFVSSALQRIQTISSLEKAISNADLCIEAVSENLELKKKIFATLDANASEKTIFASNTSSLSVGDIASSTKRLDRFGGLHFFSPVPMMKLVEVIRIKETSDETFNKLFEYSKKIGKVPVSCKDTPGFIVNRLLLPYMNDAFRMAERGDASIQDIDIAMKLGTGYPMGPFELADFVGLDVCLAILDGWVERYPNQKEFQPTDGLKNLVKLGKLGRKTGEGFHNYKK